MFPMPVRRLSADDLRKGRDTHRRHGRVHRSRADRSDRRPGVLADEVMGTFKPRPRSYKYRQANDYASDFEPLVRLIEERSTTEGSAEFLRIVQKAIDQAVRTILRSDDSSGLQGMQIQRLLEAHATAAKRSSLVKADTKPRSTEGLSVRGGAGA